MKQNTQTKNAEPVEGFTGGDWIYAPHMNEQYKEKRITADDGTKYHRHKVIAIIWEHPQQLGEAEANAALIAAAPELFQMVKDLKNCIKRLTQDNLPQFERDTEAQWEGEAHELLTRINPNYYRNANEVNQ